MRNLVENKINSKQIRDLISNDISSSIFIDAGAGAGKTTSIVGRVLNQIKCGIDPKRIVIITFTNKATEEIQGRITEAVRKAMNDENYEEFERNIFKKAFTNLSSMNISTIHSFCFTLLSEKSFNIKFPIGVELIEENDAVDEQTKLFSKFIKGLSRTDFMKLYKNDKFRYKDIFDIYVEFCKYEDAKYKLVKPKLEEFVNVLDALANFKDKALSICENLMDDVNLYKNDKDKTYDPISYASAGLKRILVKIDKILEFKKSDILDYINENRNDKLIKLLNDLIMPTEINEKGDIKSAKVTTKKKRSEGKLEELAIAIEEIKEPILNLFNLYKSNELYYSLVDVIETAYLAYLFYKENRSRLTISNNQLLYLTDQLMKNYEARRFFAEKYDCIYVDEFQDTDNLQASFIWALTSEIDNIHREQGLNYGPLVVVGDPKQSIYRFRGAEPELFFEIKDKYIERESIIYSLTYNFRSNNLILDYVNDEFMNKDIQGNNPYTSMLYNDNHIVPAPINEKCIAGVFELPVEDLEHGSEEEYVASFIRKMVDEEYYIPKFNKESKRYEWKPIEYKDFMVLFRSFKKSIRFINQFKNYSIPVSINGEIDMTLEAGIKIFRRVFRGLVLPTDKLSKMGAIEALRMNDFYSCETEDESFKFYNDLYSYLYKETRNMSAYAKAMYLVNHLELILASNDSYQSIRAKLEQMVENGLCKNFVNGPALADYFDSYVESKIPELLVMKKEVNTVRFMNAHKSKGLESPIVIWVCNEKKAEPRDRYYKKGNTFYYNVEGNKELLSAKEMEEIREFGRLEYVVATRAEACFIYSPFISEGALFKRENYNYDINDLKKYQIGALPTVEIIEPTNLKLDVYEPADTIYANNEATIISTSPSSYEVHSGREKGIKDEFRPTGNILGTVMHRALELMVLRREDNIFESYSLSSINQSVRQAILESCNDIDISDYPKYTNFLTAVLKAAIELYKDKKYFINSMEVEPEFGYTIYDDELKNNKFSINGEGLPILLNGSMDLFIKYQNSILIIDYKSDFAGYKNDEQFSNILKEEYQNQLNVYKKSAEVLYPNISDIKAKIIYFKNYDNINSKIEAVEVEV